MLRRSSSITVEQAMKSEWGDKRPCTIALKNILAVCCVIKQCYIFEFIQENILNVHKETIIKIFMAYLVIRTNPNIHQWVIVVIQREFFSAIKQNKPLKHAIMLDKSQKHYIKQKRHK